jgi:hypothetical protein
MPATIGRAIDARLDQAPEEARLISTE